MLYLYIERRKNALSLIVDKSSKNNMNYHARNNSEILRAKQLLVESLAIRGESARKCCETMQGNYDTR